MRGSAVFFLFLVASSSFLPVLTAEAPAKYEFQAEISRLMDIIINSLYTHKEVFLRELISNASDALDKIRFMSLKDPSALGEGELKELDIHIEFDREAKTLSITDKGIGMTKEDLINNLGTVAKSGTSNFLEAMASGGDLSLIGQFGVGFYSTFLVADRVTVVSKHNDGSQHIWESTADSFFTVNPDPEGDTLGRGTRVVLHLKDDATEFLDQEKLKELVGHYSQFINFPIYLKTSKSVSKEVPVEDEEETETVDEEKKEDEAVEEDKEEEKKPKTKTVTETVWEWTQLNTNKAIWLRNKEEITEQEYFDFFKSLTKESEDPLSYTHFSAEGEVDFRSILFVPGKAAWNQFDNYYGKTSGLKLYVRRVLISDSFEDLIPRYLNFIKGIVDSDELPLNVSREQLQQHKLIKTLSKKLVAKTLEMIKKLAEQGDEIEDEEEDEDETDEENQEEKKPETKEKAENEKYATFWKHFGKNIKLGVVEDQANRAKLSKLLRFYSTKSGDKLISLQEYINRMKPQQENIYYIAGDNKEALLKSPMLQKLNQKDYEVLLLVDSIDEYTMQHLSEFNDKKLVSVTKGELKFGDESEKEKKKEKKLKEMYQPLLDWWKDLLGEKVEKVSISKRLADDPCVVVASQYGWSANMERIMKAQAFANDQASTFMSAKKTLEINPHHPVIKELLKRVNEDNKDSAQDLGHMLFDTALINSGFQLEDPSDFVARLNKMTAQSIGVDPSAPVVEEDIPLDEEPEKEESKEGEDEEVSADQPKDEL